MTKDKIISKVADDIVYYIQMNGHETDHIVVEKMLKNFYKELIMIEAYERNMKGIDD